MGIHWFKLLPITLFHMRITQAGEAELSPAEIVYDRPLRTPWNQNTPKVVHFHHMTTEMTDYVLSLTKVLRDLHSSIQPAYIELPPLTTSSRVIL